METAFIIRGRLREKAFVSDGPMPNVDGPAELIVYRERTTPEGGSSESMFELFGKAHNLRTGEDIDLQVQQERLSWDKP